MRDIFKLFLATLTFSTSLGQSKEEKEVIREGELLYQIETASWKGTDILLNKFADQRQNIGGYFSYVNKGSTWCIFYSKDDYPKVLVTIAFVDDKNATVITSGQERQLSRLEMHLLVIRQKTMKQLQTDSLFKFYPDTNLNVIPLIDKNGKRAYVLTGPKKEGVVIFGNDYLLRFDDDFKLLEKKSLHKSILNIEYGKVDNQAMLATMHTHLLETGKLITATDVCTLMLYSKFAKWGQHYVISDKSVSIWNCSTNQLTVMTREAWDKINNDQKSKQ
jgi:hypothetical protein